MFLTFWYGIDSTVTVGPFESHKVDCLNLDHLVLVKSLKHSSIKNDSVLKLEVNRQKCFKLFTVLKINLKTVFNLLEL